MLIERKLKIYYLLLFFSTSPEVFDTLVHGFEGVVDIVCQ